MPTWKRTIDLRDAVSQYKTDEDIPRVAEAAERKIEESGWLADTKWPASLRASLKQLRQATTAREYANAFEYIYDQADLERVWIETS